MFCNLATLELISLSHCCSHFAAASRHPSFAVWVGTCTLRLQQHSQGAVSISETAMQDELDSAERQPPKEVDEDSEGVPSERPVKADRPILGLASYALSSVFLATMLTFAKLLGRREMPVFEILLARSTSILAIALTICAKDHVNPFGNR